LRAFLGRLERPTRGLGIRGSLFLPDLKLRPPNYGLNDRQFFHHQEAKSRKLKKEFRNNSTSLITFKASDVPHKKLSQFLSETGQI
jgi:hypothetical protein